MRNEDIRKVVELRERIRDALSYVKRICGANKFVRWAMERKDPADKEERTTEKSDGFCSC